MMLDLTCGIFIGVSSRQFRMENIRIPAGCIQYLNIYSMIFKGLRSKITCLGASLFILLCPSLSEAAGPIGRELLLFEEIPIVTTAAKYPQRLSDSPLTIYVISEDDIRASGATTIPELFRIIPGINVMATSASDFNVSSRGGNQLLANKLLVLVDGRYVYQDMYGMVFWESLTVLPEDIRQIEIVKGPSSVLYGANAFSGVINIITKDPKDDQGTTISFMEGEPGIDTRSIIHRGRRGNVSYKVSASYRLVDKWEETDVAAKGFPEGPSSSEDMRKYWGLLQYHPDRETSVSLSGGKSYGTMEFFPIEYLTVLPINKKLEWYRLKYSDSRLMAHYFENSGLLGFYDSYSDTAEYDAEEGEITYSFDAGERNHLTAGAMRKENKVVFGSGTEYEYSGKKRQWGLYLEDEFRATNRTTLFLGVRYDENYISEDYKVHIPSLISSQSSPRGGIVYHLGDTDSLKLSVGKAYRNPTHFENYLLFIETVATGADLGLPFLNDFDFSLQGTHDLDPEEIVTYNLGYRADREDYTVTADIFYNDIKNVIQHRYRTGNILDADNDINFWKDYQNVYSAHSYGAELLVEKRLNSSLSGLISYAFLREYSDDTGERIKTSPEHKAAAEIRQKFGDDMTLNIQGVYVGGTEWELESFDIDESGLPSTVLLESVPVRFKVPSFTLVNVRLGIKLGENIEVSFAGFNIFNDRHREFPDINMPIYDPGTFDEFAALANSRPNTIGKRLTASLRVDF